MDFTDKTCTRTDSVTLASVFWREEMQIPLLVTVLPPFTVNTGIWEHWLDKTKMT